MINWRFCKGLTLEWQIGHGLTLDWQISPGLTLDWRMDDQLARIGTELALDEWTLDVHRIGAGLTTWIDIRSRWIGTELAPDRDALVSAWHQIAIRLPLD